MRDWVSMLSDDELREEIEKAVYKHTVGLFEAGEHRGVLRGNGHHMAQELARRATEIWKEHLQDKPNA